MARFVFRYGVPCGDRNRLPSRRSVAGISATFRPGALAGPLRASPTAELRSSAEPSAPENSCGEIIKIPWRRQASDPSRKRKESNGTAELHGLAHPGRLLTRVVSRMFGFGGCQLWRGLGVACRVVGVGRWFSGRCVPHGGGLSRVVGGFPDAGRGSQILGMVSVIWAAAVVVVRIFRLCLAGGVGVALGMVRCCSRQAAPLQDRHWRAGRRPGGGRADSRAAGRRPGGQQGSRAAAGRAAGQPGGGRAGSRAAGRLGLRRGW